MALTEQTYFWEQNYKDIKTGGKALKASRWLPAEAHTEIHPAQLGNLWVAISRARLDALGPPGMEGAAPNPDHCGISAHCVLGLGHCPSLWEPCCPNHPKFRLNWGQRAQTLRGRWVWSVGHGPQGVQRVKVLYWNPAEIYLGLNYLTSFQGWAFISLLFWVSSSISEAPEVLHKQEFRKTQNRCKRLRERWPNFVIISSVNGIYRLINGSTYLWQHWWMTYCRKKWRLMHCSAPN